MTTTKNEENQSRLKRYFKWFLIGGILLLSGLATIVGANVYIAPSLKQEVVVFCALVFGGIGGLITAIAYLKMLALRFKHFLENDKNEPSD
jgi:uncharacterized membrane protein